MNRELFATLWEVQVLVERWRRHDNQIRPHRALGLRPPAPETIVPQHCAYVTFNLVQPRGAGLIFGSKSLRWAEIDRAEIRVSYLSRYERDEPGHMLRAPFRLVIFSKPISAKPPVRINIKLINRGDLQKLVERLDASITGYKVSVPSWITPVARD